MCDHVTPVQGGITSAKEGIISEFMAMKGYMIHTLWHCGDVSLEWSGHPFHHVLSRVLHLCTALSTSVMSAHYETS